jgi:co-chaperonin GroES (HSP10)
MTDLDTISTMTRVYGDNVLIRKCGLGQQLPGGRGIAKDDGSPLLFFSQYFSDTTNFVEIIDVGPDCKWFMPRHSQRRSGRKFGDSTLCPETCESMTHVVEHYWFIKESYLFPMIFSESGIEAIGDALVLRMPEKDANNLIITPDVIEDKQNELQVISVGENVRERIFAGDTILIAGEVRVFAVDGKRYGVLREEDVLGVEEK